MPNSSIIPIQHKDSKIFLGTGFVISSNGQGSYILTCDHVIRENGEILPLSILESSEVIVAKNGYELGVDLAILYASNLKSLPTLQLESLDSNDSREFYIISWERRATLRSTTRHGQLGETHLTTYEPGNQIIRGWELILNEGEEGFKKGNSGSPVIDKKTKRVCGVVNSKENIGGTALDISAISLIWDEIPSSVLSISTYPSPFQISFRNRKVEKKTILEWMESGRKVQIYSSSGLGKTYLMREVLSKFEKQTKVKTIWMDFDISHDDDDFDYSVVQEAFLNEILNQTRDENTLNITVLTRKAVMDEIAIALSEYKKIILFIDNADKGDSRLRNWVRNGFLQKLESDYSISIDVLASALQIIPEWTGFDKGPIFYQLPLSGFYDRIIIKEMLSEVIEHFGARNIKEEQRNNSHTWKQKLETMCDGILKISKGHPLVIAKIILNAASENRFLITDYFSREYMGLCNSVLLPIVSARILPRIQGADDMREAFRSLCIFRYSFLDLIRELAENSAPPELGGSWLPFFNRKNDGESWYFWTGLKKTHLILKLSERQMYPIAPIERQLISSVLKAEDPELFQARNLRAKIFYSSLINNNSVPLLNRASYSFEVLYHMTNDGNQYSKNDFRNIVAGFLQQNRTEPYYSETTEQMSCWITSDKELKEAVSELYGEELYTELVELLSFANNY